jgi:hypothetical protein
MHFLLVVEEMGIGFGHWPNCYLKIPSIRGIWGFPFYDKSNCNYQHWMLMIYGVFIRDGVIKETFVMIYYKCCLNIWICK